MSEHVLLLEENIPKVAERFKMSEKELRGSYLTAQVYGIDKISVYGRSVVFVVPQLKYTEEGESYYDMGDIL